VRQATQRALMSAAARVVPNGHRSVPRVVGLCYHSVDPHLRSSVEPGLFRAHVEWLNDQCTIVPFDRLVAEASEARPATRPVVALTFDDGFADNFEHAFPILAATNTPATFFVTAGFIDGDPSVVARMRVLRRGSEVRAMSWDQLRELRAAGFAVGSHTYSHANLGSLSAADATDEIERAKEILEERLEAPVPLFAYPWGRPRRHFTAETTSLVARAGHTDAAAVLFRAVKPAEDRLAVPRFFVADESIRTLEQKVRGSWDIVGHMQERLPRWLLETTLDRAFGSNLA
jgi:peptidoglycan/xylan/chitin deacetylase (PgdA/CDA1 family)